MLGPNKPPKAVNIWKSYMCTTVEETNIESILAVMIFIYLQPLFTTWKVYWPAPSSLVGSVGRALHWYRRGHGFKSRTGLTFLYFQKFWKRSLYQWKLWFFTPYRNSIGLNDIEIGLEFPESRTLLALERSKHTNDRLIVKPNLETAESIVAKNNYSGEELWLNPITVKGLNIKKPETQPLQ